MKKKYIIYLVLIIFISCKNEYKTYYPNGALHILSQENGNHKLDGEFKEFYENGTIEAISNYTNGRLDSTLLYEKNGQLSLALHYKKNDTIYCKNFKDNKLERSGNIYKKRKIGYWYTYNKMGLKTAKYEYINLKNNEYLNQNWNYDNQGRLIRNAGNNYTISYAKKNYAVGDTVIFKIHYNSQLGKDSKAILYLSPKIKNDFSNIDQVKFGPYYSNASNNDFKLYTIFSENGNKNIRGYIQESLFQKDKPKEDQYLMREVYFNVPLFIKKKQ